MAQLARTPLPPYFAVVFSSVRTADDADGYGQTADRMVELAGSMPGFLGLDSVRGDNGVGITVSYWESEEAIRAWQKHAEHLEAQRLGRDRWYEQFEMRVCRVERAYRFDRRQAWYRGTPCRERNWRTWNRTSRSMWRGTSCDSHAVHSRFHHVRFAIPVRGTECRGTMAQVYPRSLFSASPAVTAPALDFPLAHRQFAASCFNAAWDLIDKPHRTPDEDDQMIHVAHASVWHWTQREDCTPVKLSIGYWQLSRVYALARRPQEARHYAERCLQVTPADQPFYVGYAREALARAERLAGNAEASARHLAAGREQAAMVKDESERQALTADLDSLA